MPSRLHTGHVPVCGTVAQLGDGIRQSKDESSGVAVCSANWLADDVGGDEVADMRWRTGK